MTQTFFQSSFVKCYKIYHNSFLTHVNYYYFKIIIVNRFNVLIIIYYTIIISFIMIFTIYLIKSNFQYLI